jgi:hypothetical protein
MQVEQFFQQQVEPYEALCGRMTDDGLIRELENIRAGRTELDRREQVVQMERSRRYRINNWFQEEINSTELHF